MTLKVGDVGVVHHFSRDASDREAVIVKVGRKWATAESRDEFRRDMGRFDKDTGAEDGRGYSPNAVFLTPEMAAHRDALIAANETCKNHGVAFLLATRWSDDDKLALAAWLDDRFGENAKSPKGGSK